MAHAGAPAGATCTNKQKNQTETKTDTENKTTKQMTHNVQTPIWCWQITARAQFSRNACLVRRVSGIATSRFHNRQMASVAVCATGKHSSLCLMGTGYAKRHPACR